MERLKSNIRSSCSFCGSTGANHPFAKRNSPAVNTNRVRRIHSEPLRTRDRRPTRTVPCTRSAGVLGMGKRRRATDIYVAASASSVSDLPLAELQVASSRGRHGTIPKGRVLRVSYLLYMAGVAHLRLGRRWASPGSFSLQREHAPRRSQLERTNTTAWRRDWPRFNQRGQHCCMRLQSADVARADPHLAPHFGPDRSSQANLR